jgi:hypothetical protein
MKKAIIGTTTLAAMSTGVVVAVAGSGRTWPSAAYRDGTPLRARPRHTCGWFRLPWGGPDTGLASGFRESSHEQPGDLHRRRRR